MADRGLYCILNVKTAHKFFPKEILKAQELKEVGDFACMEGELPVDSEIKKLIALRYKDHSKEFQFISTTGTTIPGETRKVKRTDGSITQIKRPNVVAKYFEAAGAIDKLNHVRTGSIGLEDVCQSSNWQLKMCLCLIGFVESNAYCAQLHFGVDKELLHSAFRKQLAEELIYNTVSGRVSIMRSLRRIRSQDYDAKDHVLGEYQKGEQKKCFYCSHAGEERVINKTHWFCRTCNVPLCNNPKNDCYGKHIQHGLPKKKYRSQSKC